MKFADPYMLYLIWVVVLLFGVTVYGQRKRARILSRFASKKVYSFIVPDYSTHRPVVKGMMMIAGLFFLVMALAGPLWGFRWETVEQKGVDIMVALDCSRSMLAQDIKPSRLERAKREIIDLLRMMKSDRAGLVAFSGGAILQCPLTLDHEAFNIFLNALDPDYLPKGGTDLEGAIETAIKGFEDDVDSEKAIILITDGENTSGKPLEAAKAASEKGVRIFCIGVGREEGAPIPDKDGGFKKDNQGRIILSRVDDKGLQEIAAIARGIYVKSVAGDMDLDLIYEGQIRGKMEQKTLKSGRKKVWENRFQWFLFPALLVLLLELFVLDRKKIINFSILLVPFLLVSISAPDACHAGASTSVKKGLEAFSSQEYETAEKHFIDAQLERPEMSELYYNIGTAAYKKGDYESALKNFSQAMETDDDVLKNKIMYNIGNTHYRLGRLEQAVKEFEAVLGMNPEDSQAKENLEFVKQKIEEQKKNQQEQKDNQQENQENQSENDKSKDKSQDRKQSREDKKEPDSKPGEENQDKKQPQEKHSDRQQEGTDQNQDNDEQQRQFGNKPPDEPQADQHPGDQESGQDKNTENQAVSPGEDSGQGLDQEKMLNRLQDMPGKAMIPVYNKKQVDKDW